ncbi:hypothetical protein PHJA_002971100, partial [Phtheirospermum japonicum]
MDPTKPFAVDPPVAAAPPDDYEWSYDTRVINGQPVLRKATLQSTDGDGEYRTF